MVMVSTRLMRRMTSQASLVCGYKSSVAQALTYWLGPDTLLVNSPLHVRMGTYKKDPGPVMLQAKDDLCGLSVRAMQSAEYSDYQGEDVKK